jgi:hypothetical protein
VNPADGPPLRSIVFADRRWWVKRADKPVGPGRNRFDDSTRAVAVNADGSLTLRIHRERGSWTCAEVVGAESTGFGTYEWVLGSRVTDLDRHVVIGMFLWSDETAHSNRELDIEVSAWGGTTGVTGQFVVQPSEAPGHLQRFTVPRAVPWPCSFRWARRNVTFRAGHSSAWTFEGEGVPPLDHTHPRINLWLRNGAEPDTQDSIEVRFNDFRFTPLAG